MTQLSLEIIEGPGVGLQVPLRGPLVIGRGEEADLVLDNINTSRAHARVKPNPDRDDSVIVEDLDSSNGTFVNDSEVHGPMPMFAGDQLLVGVSVLTISVADSGDRRTTAVLPLRSVAPTRSPLPPPALAAPPASAGYVHRQQPPVAPPRIAELERLLDANVKFRAYTAPLAILILVALVVCVYLGAR